jgi:hypothetical protein
MLPHLYTERSPLYKAVDEGDEDYIKKFLETPHTSDDVNEKGGNGRGPLHLAANNNIYKVIPLLISDPLIDVNQLDSYGCSPFFYACTNNSADSVRELLKCKKLNTRSCRVNENGVVISLSPFELAVRSGLVNVIKEWIASEVKLPHEVWGLEIRGCVKWVEQRKTLSAEMRNYFSTHRESNVIAMCELLGDYLKDAEGTKLRVSLELKAKIVAEEMK